MPRRPGILLSPEQKRIVWHLRTFGPTARSELAQQLGIHNGALTRLSRELLALGVIEEAEQVHSGPRGRPTVPLAVSPGAGYAAGATVHPGWLELVLVDFSGAVLVRESEPFDSPDPRDFVEHLDRRLRALAAENNMMRSRFLGLGVGTPGQVMAEDSARRWTVDWLAGWRVIDNHHYFEDALGIPAWVEETATAAGLAEYYDTGLIRTCAAAMIIFVSHGVGGGVISSRDILRGEFGNAGDIGRLFPNTAPRPSGLDLLGCLQRAGADVHSVRDIGCHQDHYAAVIDAWIERATEQLGLAIHSGTAWLDPGAVVLSGALPQSILDSLGERLRGANWTKRPDWLPVPTFHVSRLGSWAGAIGAALIPIHKILSQE
ncbi:ROK family protein [Sphingomonas sp. MMS24-J13]|uniref:ROK family transcriptional regulator n=1 Tax=Sphingomonas sp. MMS24-J13 TaxID=3238686 RepID=UPI00384B17F8